MLDLHLLRKNMEAVSQALAKRGFELDIDRLQSLERQTQGNPGRYREAAVERETVTRSE